MSMFTKTIGLACIAAVLVTPYAIAQEPGEKPPAAVQGQLEAVKGELEAALAAMDETGVYAAVKKAREVLGPYAGLPESPEQYMTPVCTDAPDMAAVGRRVHEGLQAGLGNHGSRSTLALENKMELRDAAYIAVLCLAMADAGAPAPEQYIARAREELDYLLARQYKSGMFPYPAYPGGGSPAHVRAMVERLRQGDPDAVWNGYLVLDRKGNQFDTGCCAYAMIKGYESTGEGAYLESAKKAAAWSMALGLSTNWNYNAFSVWHLAALHRVTGHKPYLDSAVEKAVLGVLPGLMDTGRWVDQHNAKFSYHYIMVRALSELVRAMPTNHARYKEIRDKTMLAAETRARELLAKGPSNVESTLWGLVAFLENVGPSAVCQKAANAIVNGTVSSGRLNLTATPLYLRYMAKHGIGRGHG